jgi:hypothetical protein
MKSIWASQALTPLENTMATVVAAAASPALAKLAKGKKKSGPDDPSGNTMTDDAPPLPPAVLYSARVRSPIISVPASGVEAVSEPGAALTTNTDASVSKLSINKAWAPEAQKTARITAGRVVPIRKKFI